MAPAFNPKFKVLVDSWWLFFNGFNVQITTVFEFPNIFNGEIKILPDRQGERILVSFESL
jgi:hypothetical protein